ncbi:sensor histidine kinase KdpD, partial [uncultured Enorma sp.]
APAPPVSAEASEIVSIPMGDGIFLPVRTHDEAFGVVGIRAAERDIDSFELSIARSIIGECALELAREREAREREEAAVLARNEQLRANLLRSLGHDLRTPLTAISGAAAILRDDSGRLAPEQRRALLDDVYHDSLWLIDMVENLLTITHFDEGTIKLTLNSELIDDIFEAAVSHLANQAGEHHIVIEPADEILLVRIDASLIIQVLTNLVGNAIKYTPAGSTIRLYARREGALVRVTVADDGPGVADDDKPHVFDRFYSGAKAERPADAQRSFGLGLALCRSIVEAHGGAIEVHDNVPHGAVFSFTLPAEEVAIHG